MQSFFFIINSRIGSEKIKQLQSAIDTYLSDKQVQLTYTAYGGHATLLAQEALQLKDTVVVAVGGDGTVNEVIQQLACTNVPLAIIPTGSGNGLARHCQIPINMTQAVALLATGHLLTIDLGKANEKYFISNAGVGFDAWVCNTIKTTKSRGLKMYVWKVIKHYFSYHKDLYTLTTDEKYLKQHAFFLNIANGKEFGYGFQIAPEASLQDGLLDVILAKSITPFNGLKFVIDGWRKRLHKNKNCIYFKTKKIKIESPQLRYFQTDGDAHDCNGICEITLIENALNIMVPSEIKHI
ncbi:MAG: diacylglycerol kinase family lipid kinase [Bacteroidetes bacterium]|nr:diacylglycerol kinase family lipid kinase [Bacteroidota bacterium]